MYGDHSEKVTQNYSAEGLIITEWNCTCHHQYAIRFWDRPRRTPCCERTERKTTTASKLIRSTRELLIRGKKRRYTYSNFNAKDVTLHLRLNMSCVLVSVTNSRSWSDMPFHARSDVLVKDSISSNHKIDQARILTLHPVVYSGSVRTETQVGWCENALIYKSFRMTQLISFLHKQLNVLGNPSVHGDCFSVSYARL